MIKGAGDWLVSFVTNTQFPGKKSKMQMYQRMCVRPCMCVSPVMDWPPVEGGFKMTHMNHWITRVVTATHWSGLMWQLSPSVMKVGDMWCSSLLPASPTPAKHVSIVSHWSLPNTHTQLHDKLKSDSYSTNVTANNKAKWQGSDAAPKTPRQQRGSAFDLLSPPLPNEWRR